MIKPVRKIYPVYFLIDAVLIIFIFYLSYYYRYNPLPYFFNFSEIHLPNAQSYLFLFCLWFIFITLSFKRRGLYVTDRGLIIPKEVFRIVVSIFYASVLIAAIIFFSKFKDFSRQIFLSSFFLLCFCLSGWRMAKKIILRKMIAKGFHNINILIVGAGKMGRFILSHIKENPAWGFKVVGFLDDYKSVPVEGVGVLGTLNDLPDVARRHFVEEVIITIPSERKSISNLIRYARKKRMGIRIVPDNFSDPLPLVSISYLGVIPVLTYKKHNPHPAGLALKRIFDCLVSSLLLIILFPLFIVIAFAIKLTSKGPILYVQHRAGFKGRPFDFYKFRSMVKDADRLKADLMNKNEVKGGIIFKIKDDPRVTKVGKFLRRYSLDEVPQLFNVLKGDMSLVGPRPPILNEVDNYTHDQMQRLSLRPGITGMSQVRGRSELTFRRWVKWDLWYISNWSFGLDLRILWWTIAAVSKKRGAY